MIESVISLLKATTPALRERYLERIRTVDGREARELEQRLAWLIERDRHGSQGASSGLVTLERVRRRA